MPPRAKFTREQIIAAALEITRQEGFSYVTARALGKKLGSSACPIFTVFENMEEVRQGVLAAARAVYRGYVERGLQESIAFKGVGTQYIRFSVEEPKLFQLLFMREQENPKDFESVLPILEESYEEILRSITEGYGLEKTRADWLYRHLWIYTHGIASLCATKMCRFTGSEISQMMTEVFIGLLKQEKGRMQ